MSVKQYFLGGNTAHGFYSLYDSFCPPEDGGFLWIIKGGPGCGKSSFMKRIGLAAEKRGLDVEYVLCSGDPASVDGVRIPALGVGYVDGTAPHTLDVPFPAVSGSYLDLGQFYDMTALREKKSEIIGLNRTYKSCYQESYRILSAASGAGAAILTPQREPHLTFSAVKKAPGSLTRRFTQAICCKGVVTAEPVVSRCIGGFADVQALAEEARQAGLDVVLHPHPLLPELAESVTLTGSGERYSADCRALDDAFSPFVADAIEVLRRAKALHDELEQVYNPRVDFDSVYALAGQHIARLFPEA